MRTKITMSTGEVFVIDKHPDAFLEEFTGEDYDVIAKDFVRIPGEADYDNSRLISTRHILKIEIIND